MSRKPFYEVNNSAFLFPGKLAKPGDREGPEEPVRQWCAFELIRGYGISVSDLEFERPARVGSKTYRIDILVSRGGVPWVVVECKKPRHKNPKDGMAQAISYADSQEIQAKYAVYTNGTAWLVNRRVSGQWVALPDLPSNIADPANEPIIDLLRGVDVLAPLLCQLGEPIEGRDAKRFMDALQRFFIGTNLLTSDADRDLLIATDNLLRVLSIGPSDAHYWFDKLNVARNHYEAYRANKNIGHEIFFTADQDPGQSAMHHLHGDLLSMIEGTESLIGCDLLILRLNIALLEYGRLLEGPGKAYPALGQNVHHALRDFLNFTIAVHLNATLPDSLDDTSVGDMRSYCRSAWQSFDTEPPEFRPSPWNVVSGLMRFFLRQLCFWRKP
jgi:hypothetical protein